MLILAMENPVLHQMHGKQYLPYLFTSRFRIFSKNSKSSFLKSHKYMNSFMGAHLTSCTAETKPIYASKKNFCLIKPLNVCVCAGVGYLASFFSSTTRDSLCRAADIMNNGVTIYHGLCLPFPRFTGKQWLCFDRGWKKKTSRLKVWRHLAVLHLF